MHPFIEVRKISQHAQRLKNMFKYPWQNFRTTSCLSEAEFWFSFQIWKCSNHQYNFLLFNCTRNFGCIETFSLKLCCAFFLFLFPGGPVFLLILHLCNFRHRCHDFKREIKNYKRLQRYIGKDFETLTQPLLRTFPWIW